MMTGQEKAGRSPSRLRLSFEEAHLAHFTMCLSEGLRREGLRTVGFPWQGSSSGGFSNSAVSKMIRRRKSNSI